MKAASHKGCPFCGCFDVAVKETSTFRWRAAVCQRCGAQAGEVRIQTLGEGTQREWEEAAVRAALEEWDTRA